MIDPVRELKIRAEILQRKIASRQPAALARLRRLPEFRAYSDDELETAAAKVLRRQCLTLLATELGFQGKGSFIEVLGLEPAAPEWTPASTGCVHWTMGRAYRRTGNYGSAHSKLSVRRDATTYLTTVAVLGAVAAIASYLPARRVARVQPLVALRQE